MGLKVAEEDEKPSGHDPSIIHYITKCRGFLSGLLLVSFLVISIAIYLLALYKFGKLLIIENKISLTDMLHLVDYVLISFTIGTVGVKVFYKLRKYGLDEDTSSSAKDENIVDNTMIKMIILTLSITFLNFILSSFSKITDINSANVTVGFNIMFIGISIGLVICSLSYFVNHSK